MDLYDISNDIISFLSDTFRIPESSLQWPYVIPDLIVPLILLWYAFYKILERIGIFRYQQGINAIIAIVIAFPLLAIIPEATFIFFLFSIGTIILLGIRSLRYKILFILLILIYFLFLVPNIEYLQI